MSAIRWIARAKMGGGDAPAAGVATRFPPRGHEAFIVGLIEERKDITLNEMVARLSDEQPKRVERAWLRGRGWTYKKSPHTHWSRIALTS